MVVDDPIPLGELARKIINVATARQDLPVLSTGLYRQVWSALELGDAPLFRNSVYEYRRIAEKLNRPYELAVSSNMLATIAQIEGRFVDAEASGQEALVHAADIENGNFSWVYFANAGLRSVDTGSGGATFDFMQAARSGFIGIPTFAAAHAAVAAHVGEIAVANELVEEQVGRGGENLDQDWSYLSAERLPVVGFLAWACAMSGNTLHAQTLQNRLSDIAAFGVRVVRVAPFGAWIGPIDHHIGSLHRLLGDFDSADRHLTQALTVEAEMNGQPFQIRTMLELAAVATAQGGHVAQSVAARWRGKAEELATSIGLESIVLADLIRQM